MCRLGWFLCLVIGTFACAGDPQARLLEHLERAEQAAEARQYREAVVHYLSAIELRPDAGGPRVKLAEVYVALNDPTGALEQYIRAADLMPDDADVQLAAGKLLALQGRFQDARSRAEHVLARDPKNVDAQLLLGNVALGQKDLEGAIAEIEEAVTLDPTQGRAQVNLGIAQMAKGNQQEAKVAFEKAVELDGQSVGAGLSLAGFYWSTGDIAAAERELQRVLAIDPEHKVANRTIAAVYIATKRPSQAEPYLKRAAAGGDARGREALADFYTATGRLPEATAILEELAQDPARAAAAKTKLAAIAYRQGRTADAHRDLDRVLTSSQQLPSALLTKAEFLLAERKPDEALTNLDAAIKSDPRLIRAHYLRGTILASRKETTGAAAAFTEVLKLNPRATVAQLQLARLNLTSGNADASVVFAREAAGARPQDPVSRVVLIDSLIATGRLAEAERELAPLRAQHPNVSTVLVRTGRLAVMKNDLRGGREAFERALQSEWRSLDALSGLVGVDVAEKRAADAVARVERYLARIPDNPELLMLAARTYVAAGRTADGERALESAIRQQPENLAAYSMLGQILLSQRKLDQARSRFEEVLRHKPDDVATEMLVAMIHAAQNRPEDARKRYEAILAREPRAVAAANNLAWLLAESGEDLERAGQLAEFARRELPDDPHVAHTVGWVYYKRQLPERAIPEFERSLSKDANNAVYLYHLGLASFDAGQRVKARRALERALSVRSDFQGADRARTLLASLKN